MHHHTHQGRVPFALVDPHAFYEVNPFAPTGWTAGAMPPRLCLVRIAKQPDGGDTGSADLSEGPLT